MEAPTDRQVSIIREEFVPLRFRKSGRDPTVLQVSKTGKGSVPLKFDRSKEERLTGPRTDPVDPKVRNPQKKLALLAKQQSQKDDTRESGRDPTVLLTSKTGEGLMPLKNHQDKHDRPVGPWRTFADHHPSKPKRKLVILVNRQDGTGNSGRDPAVLQPSGTAKGLVPPAQKSLIPLLNRRVKKDRYVEPGRDPTGLPAPDTKTNIRPLMSRRNKEDRSTGPWKDPPDLPVSEIIRELPSHMNLLGIPDRLMEPWKVPVRRNIPAIREGPILFVSVRKQRQRKYESRAGPDRPARFRRTKQQL